MKNLTFAPETTTTSLGHIMPVEALKNLFVLNGASKGGSFTVRSLKTGKDYTYKISTKEFKGREYTHIFVEVNYLDFKYLGFFSESEGKLIHKKVQVESPSAVAIAYILNHVKKGNFTLLQSQIEVFHLGACLRCNRPLTDAVSIETGFGPVCRKK
jgi:hypothetical protein